MSGIRGSGLGVEVGATVGTGVGVTVGVGGGVTVGVTGFGERDAGVRGFGTAFDGGAELLALGTDSDSAGASFGRLAGFHASVE